MPEIGASLREARMRAGLDVTAVEERTKIRAKFLRAMENEEWDVLPGPAYVKSFLRTYGDAVGLDGRVLVEEFKLRHEGLSEVELQPIGATRTRSPVGRSRSGRGGPPRSPRPPRGPRLGPVGVLLIGLVALAAALWIFGFVTDDEDGAGTTTTTARSDRDTEPARTSTTSAAERRRERAAARRRARERRARRRVALVLVPTAPVSVCLRDAAGRRTLVANEILTPASSRRTYRSRRFTMTLGNGSVDLLVNGRRRDVPASDVPLAYALSRANGLRRLPAGSGPQCGA